MVDLLLNPQIFPFSFDGDMEFSSKRVRAFLVANLPLDGMFLV